MKPKRNGWMLVGIGLALIAGAASSVFARPAPTGDYNLHAEGYELVTPNSGTPALVNVNTIGQLVAQPDGSVIGAETFTAVDPALPPGSASEDVCTGTVTGNITAPAGGFGSGSGDFTISLTYAPSSGSTGAYCIPATSTLTCSRALLHVNLVDDLDAGLYRCIATNVTAGAGAAATINGASMRGMLDPARGSNSSTD